MNTNTQGDQNHEASARAIPPGTAEHPNGGCQTASAPGVVPSLLNDPNVLSRIEEAIRSGGYAGDLAAPTLGYLAMTSRLLDRPLHLAMVAASGAGKNRAVDAARAL